MRAQTSASGRPTCGTKNRKTAGAKEMTLNTKMSSSLQTTSCERAQSSSTQSAASAQAGYTAQNRGKMNQRSQVTREAEKRKGAMEKTANRMLHSSVCTLTQRATAVDTQTTVSAQEPVKLAIQLRTQAKRINAAGVSCGKGKRAAALPRGPAAWTLAKFCNWSRSPSTVTDRLSSA